MRELPLAGFGGMLVEAGMRRVKGSRRDCGHLELPGGGWSETGRRGRGESFRARLFGLDCVLLPREVPGGRRRCFGRGS